jgi:hypothetical protein
MLLNAALAMAYVLVGSFRELLSFKCTHFPAHLCTYSIVDRLSIAMTELSVFVATVGSFFVLRSLPADPNKESAHKYHQTPTINLAIFCSIGSLILIRSAIAHILQFLIIAVFFGAGLIIYRLALGRHRRPITAGR